ncbi:MAG: triple tyrosine motif-containing protein [Clostridium sp.]|uniref:triple tyrosine motif-containing protein n=1 Tax=Clostridium sp. TaxID=1506 RepID=UPI00306C7BFB
MKTLNKKLVKQISKMLLVLLAFNLVATNGIKASAATAATITYDVNGELKAGKTVDITVNANNVSELYGASFDFAYDPTIMTVESATQGTIFGSDAVSIPVKTLKSGSVEYALMLNGANSTAKAKTGSLVTLKVKLLKDATVTLKTSDSNAALSATGINCRVKLAKSGYQTSDIKYTAANKQIVIGNPEPEILKITSFKANKATGTVGSATTFTATASPSTGVEYQFYAKKDGGAWVEIQKYSTKNTVSWTPNEAGNYLIRARAKNATASDLVDLKYTVNGNESTAPKITSFVANKTTGTVGSVTTFTATATPSTGAQYQFYVKKNGGTWVEVQAYSSKNTLAWNPSEAGDYLVRARVKNSIGSDLVDLKYTVNSASTTAPKLTSFTPSKVTGAVGTTTTFTATATPSTGAQYQFYVKKNGGTWVEVQAYSSKNTLAWKPSEAGDYLVRVRVKNASGSDLIDLKYTVK